MAFAALMFAFLALIPIYEKLKFDTWPLQLGAVTMLMLLLFMLLIFGPRGGVSAVIRR